MYFKRFAAVALALLVSSFAVAATVEERSPFTQGHWWDPTRSGNGFEIFNVGEQSMAIWYTFDDAGRPIWYTAQGSLETLRWPLLKHRWENGRRGAYEVVGSLRLTVRHPESLEAVFEIGGRAGTWTLQPFHLSGVRNEVDHSGSYYDPANSGWGLTLTQQGDVLGGVLYTYDATGAPTWYAGFDRGSTGSVGFISASGACPSCTYRTTTTQSAGRLAFEFRNEFDLVIRNQLSATMAAGVNVDGARVVQLGRPSSSRPADRELATFISDTSLKAYLDLGMQNVSPMGGGVDFSAAPPAATFSTTNLQESGVDEADVAKTDGNLIYTFATGSYGARLPVIRVARVANEGASVEVLGTVPLASGPQSPTVSAGLYVKSGQLVSVTGTTASGYYPTGLWGSSSAWLRGTTNIEIFETSTTALPTSVWRAQVDGHVVSSRRIGDRLYVVARYVPYLQGFGYGTTQAAAVASNRALLAATPLASMVPSVSINGVTPISIVASTSVYLPPQGARPVTADMVLVYAIDLPRYRIAQSLAILGTAESVYASSDNLYVATSRYQYRNTFGVLLPEPAFYTTDVHQIRLGASAMTLVGSGSAEGSLGYDPDKAALRMSEHQGRLRMVTSNNLMWGAAMKNRLTILEPSTLVPGLLKTVSYLPNAQRPESLGKPGELLYSTRFLGDRLYAVTFKKIDPLYVVDLANSADPKIAGALEMPGFSEYLHPLPNGLLLGFGKDARPASEMGDGDFAWYQGLQLSLFDVSNAGAPREMQRVLVGKRGSGSALLRDHHAFSSLERADGSLSIAIPARIHDGSAPQYGYGDSAFYPWLQSGLLRFTLQGTGPSDARLVQSPSLITHTASTFGQNFYADPASYSGRSVLFRDATIYVGDGQFWRQDAAGNTFGPY